MKLQTSARHFALPLIFAISVAGPALLGGCGLDPAVDEPLGPPDADLPDAGPPDADPPDAQPLTIGLSTLAGGTQPGFQDGARNVASFDDPVNVAVAPDNVVFVADFNNGALRRVTEDGQVVTFTHQPGFHRPFGIAFSPNGDLYVQTDRNSSNDSDGKGTGALWRVNSQTGAAVLLHDNIGRVRGIDVLPDGRIVLCDYMRHVIRLYDPATDEVTDLAGREDMPGFADGRGREALFHTPYDIVVGQDKVILVSDFDNHRIRQVKLDGSVTTFAGTAVDATVDGPIAQARFQQPQGLARANDGTLYVSDPKGHVIRRIKAGQVTTVAGDGMEGYIDDIDPLTARFFGLEGIDITGDGGHLYIADGNRGIDDAPYHRLRRVAF